MSLKGKGIHEKRGLVKASKSETLHFFHGGISAGNLTPCVNSPREDYFRKPVRLILFHTQAPNPVHPNQC